MSFRKRRPGESSDACSSVPFDFHLATLDLYLTKTSRLLSRLDEAGAADRFLTLLHEFRRLPSPTRKSPTSDDVNAVLPAPEAPLGPALFVDRDSVTPRKPIYGNGSTRFGPTQHVTLDGFPGDFIGKYFNYTNDSERKSVKCTAVIERSARLDHPCLAPIVCASLPSPGHGPLFVTRFYEKEHLQAILRTPPETFWVTSTMKAMFVCDLACGIAYLHSQGLVHAELKPCKLLIDSHFHLHINGFVVNLLEQEQVIRTERVGLTHYLAPERFQGPLPRDFGHQCKLDIFALGLLFYECFGDVDWASKFGMARSSSIAETEIRPALPSGIHKRFGNLIKKCWSKDPDERPTIQEVLAEMGAMEFRFMADVDTAAVMSRARALDPTGVIAALPPPVAPPSFEAFGPGDANSRIPVTDDTNTLIAYYLSCPGTLRVSIYDEWTSFQTETPVVPTENRPAEWWTRFAGFISAVCEELGQRLPPSLAGICYHCYGLIDDAVNHRGSDLLTVVGGVIRTLVHTFDPEAPAPQVAEPVPMVVPRVHLLPCECDIFRRAKIGPRLSAGRLGEVCHAVVDSTPGPKELAVSYYEWDTSGDDPTDLLRDTIAAFGPIDHACVADLLYYQLPRPSEFLMMANEYFPGGSVKAILDRVRAQEIVEFWTPEIQVLAVCGIASALNDMHGHNLCHGNLKLESIFLDAAYCPRITGHLGFALERRWVIVSHEVQAPACVAPELYEFDDEAFDLHDLGCVGRVQNADVYAFGLVAYEILTGKPVFSTELSAADLRRQTASRDRPPIPANINRDFARIIERSWDADRTKRPSIGDIWNSLNTVDFALLAGIDPVAVKERVLALCQ
jgi:serine/threonine protein kinase